MRTEDFDESRPCKKILIQELQHQKITKPNINIQNKNQIDHLFTSIKNRKSVIDYTNKSSACNFSSIDSHTMAISMPQNVNF